MNDKRQEHEDGIDILIVEDSATQAQRLAHLLGVEGGYRVRIAADGAAGLAAARQTRPTLIVSDIAMPVMDGFTMCLEVKKDPALRGIPVILLTSLTSLYDVIRGLDCGADNFIRKPYDGKYLLGRVRFILANRALRLDERVQLGMRVSLGGQTHFITAERQQIFDLLISTYEEAIQMTEELKTQQEAIARSYQTLEGLYRITEALNPALTERAAAERALEAALDFPGVADACISLLDGEGVLRVVAAGESPAPGTPLDCSCARTLAAGELRAPELVHECAGLGGQYACVPLVSGERPLGLLHLRTASVELPSDALQVLGTIGNQIAIAVERAHLYAHMEALVRERTEALQSERNLLSAIVETSGALVVLAQASGRIVLYNRACQDSLGWPVEEAVGRMAWEVFHKPGDESAVRRFYNDLPLAQMPPQMQGEWLARDGSRRFIIWSLTSLYGVDGALEHMLFTGIDTTELRGAEERLDYVNNFDLLTGLPNRVMLRDRMRQLKAGAKAGGKVLGFMLLRLERMRLIRETLGPAAEQALLKQIAERLMANAGSDNVARFSESTFALVVTRDEVEQLARAAANALALMDRPFVYEQEDLHLDPRIGITVYPNDSLHFDELVRSAESALRSAADAVERRYQFYMPELNRGASERFKLESALRRAIEREEFVLHYQPQVALDTGAIIGFEALVRWNHPERGLVGPGGFIGVAEETGLILPIGEWVLRRACVQCREWQDAGLAVVPVSVNLSARQFSDQVPATVRRILDETGLDPKLLELELTESASMTDPEKTCEILGRLKAMGIGLSIDDFGTGYSNLNYLKRFPVDKLKLDQSFVRDIVSDPDDLSIARAVIAMAHGLRLTVIAEGVEGQGQLALLAEHGCDEIQGYLFSRPVEPEACARMLRESRTLPLESLLRTPYERTLLYVADEARPQAAVLGALRQRGYQVLCASNAAAAFEILARTEVGVIMAGAGGAQFMGRVKTMYPDVVRMVLSGHTDQQPMTDDAVFEFLATPGGDEELDAALHEAFARYEQKRAAPRAGARR
jgi:PAS domain S-box-containing protein/diguanylate cyclase (GGDEF)-like protein